jgi:CRP/FNR family transcriptional regulator, nitrogen oxide reductase regulator
MQHVGRVWRMAHRAGTPSAFLARVPVRQPRDRFRDESTQRVLSATVVSSPLFDGLPKSDLRAMLEAARIAEYSTGHCLYRQGEPAPHFYVLESGLVRLSHLTPDGQEVLLRFATPGDALGYFSLGDRGTHVATAQILKPSRLTRWERDSALRLLQSLPKVAFNLFSIAVREVGYYLDCSSRMQTQPVSQRVAWAVAELVRVFGTSTETGVVVGRGSILRDVAQLAGTTIFTASRELRNLEHREMLKRDHGCIVVLNPKKLSEG